MKILSHQEIRDVQTFVKDIQYSTDIFTRLPLEISEIIAQHLGLTQATRARRVSKGWLHILTSSQMSRCLLRPWHTPDKCSLRVPDGFSQGAIWSLKAEHMNAYRSGIAFDQKTVPLPLSRTDSIFKRVAYSNGKVAWVADNTADIHVLSLENGCGYSTIKGDGRILSHLALSGSMMVVATLTGECRITNFAKNVGHWVHLGRGKVEEMVVAKETLGVLHRPLRSSILQASVTTWTLGGTTPLHFTSSLHRSRKQALRSCDLKIMLDQSGTFVVLFERMTEAEIVYFTRFSLGGQILAEGALEIPNMEGCVEHSDTITPTDVNGWATVWSYSTREKVEGVQKTKAIYRVRYKVDHDILQLKKDSFDDFSDQISTTSNLFFCNDVAYCKTRNGGTDIMLTVIDFSNSFVAPAIMCHRMKYLYEWIEQIGPLYMSEGDLLRSIFFGDERFLIIAYRVGLITWAFDKHHVMTETDADFRQEREMAKKNRVGPWSSA